MCCRELYGRALLLRVVPSLIKFGSWCVEKEQKQPWNRHLSLRRQLPDVALNQGDVAFETRNSSLSIGPKANNLHTVDDIHPALPIRNSRSEA